MKNKVVLITGGTGSFGKAFVKHILTKEPKQVRVFSRDELKQAQLKEELNDPRVEYLCGDVRDVERLLVALEGVDICIHAAAMKRIEKCEKDPQEAIKTNIQGTINVANACLKQNIEKAILISTDKAVYPINLYGATKLVAEKAWCQSNTYRGSNHPTKFSVVRYGNVLGSRGSVIQLFREQEVIKVTDPQMTRFFITLQQACDLVEFALEVQQGGEIFIPDLKAISIYRLAHFLSGDKPIEITSQRGGEKLHEVLFTKEENKRRFYLTKTISVINPEVVTWSYKHVGRKAWDTEEDITSNDVDNYTDNEIKELLSTIK